MAWHVPFHRRQDPAPACRAGRPEKQFHDSGRRRPDPRHQANPRSREARRKTMACPGVRGDPRRLEKQRLNARPSAGRRSGELRQRQGQEALPRLSGAAEDAQRRRLRRSSAGEYPAISDFSGCSSAVPAALQIHPGRRVPGHQRGAVFVAAAVGAASSPLSSPGRAEGASPGDPRLATLQEDVDGRNKSGHDVVASAEAGPEKHLLRR